jgi:hypothetical protein
LLGSHQGGEYGFPQLSPHKLPPRGHGAEAEKKLPVISFEKGSALFLFGSTEFLCGQRA